MIYSIIDLGSNTIRLSFFKYENNKIVRLLNKKVTAGIVSYVKDGNLTQDGVNLICDILNEFKNISNNFSVKNISVVATASLRNIKNTNEAVSEIKNKTGLVIDVISGEEEAMLDFVGTSQAIDINDGIFVDIGGGSTEILMYKDNKIAKAYSIPIGSLNMYAKYVKKIIPTKEEKKEIKNNVLSYLKALTEIETCETAYGIGGTIRSAGKLSANVFNKIESEKNIITCDDVKNLLKEIDVHEKSLTQKILKISPDRIHTIIPGMIILKTIIKYYNIKTIHISPYGVREGYLYSKIIHRGGTK